MHVKRNRAKEYDIIHLVVIRKRYGASSILRQIVVYCVYYHLY